jgi:taurine dioxygenase
MSVLAEDRTLKITKIKEHIGAEVTGVDLTKPLDDETRDRLYEALVDHVVLVIRDQHFTASQFRAAAEQFGELMEDQNRLYLAPGEPLVSVLSNRHKDSTGKQAKVAKNSTWHTDHTNQERPPKFTSLYPVALPSRTRYQGDLVSHRKDRKDPRHGTGRNAGIPGRLAGNRS